MNLDLLLKPTKLLITGAQGQVGTVLTSLAKADSFFEVIALGKSNLDITDNKQIQKQLAQHLPDYVINCAAYDHVDAAEHQSDQCCDVNINGVEKLATACGDFSIPMLHLSTDYVFDGHYVSGYKEDDEVSPLGVYADSKWRGEERVRQLLPKHIILRVSWLFSEQGNNFVLNTLKAARKQKELKAVSDRRGCPTSAQDVARVILAIIKQIHSGAEAWGTYHYSGLKAISRYDFCKQILIAAGHYENFPVETLIPIAAKDYITEALRPCTSILLCKKILGTFGIRQRPWQDDLNWLMRTIYQKS